MFCIYYINNKFMQTISIYKKKQYSIIAKEHPYFKTKNM